MRSDYPVNGTEDEVKKPAIIMLRTVTELVIASIN